MNKENRPLTDLSLFLKEALKDHQDVLNEISDKCRKETKNEYLEDIVYCLIKKLDSYKYKLEFEQYFYDLQKKHENLLDKLEAVTYSRKIQAKDFQLHLREICDEYGICPQCKEFHHDGWCVYDS